MQFLDPLIRYLREDILMNPLIWGIAAVVLWMMASGFRKAWKGKDRN